MWTNSKHWMTSFLLEVVVVPWCFSLSQPVRLSQGDSSSRKVPESDARSVECRQTRWCILDRCVYILTMTIDALPLQKVICDHEIANIFCACQDGDHMNFFAYVTKDKETSRHYCHVFSVRSRVSGPSAVRPAPLFSSLIGPLLCVWACMGVGVWACMRVWVWVCGRACMYGCGARRAMTRSADPRVLTAKTC